MSDIDRIIDLAQRRKGKALHEWKPQIANNAQGGALPTLANALILLGNDEPIREMVAYNEFSSAHVIMRAAPAFEDGGARLPGPYPRSWQPADVALVCGYMQRVWCSKFNMQTVEAAMVCMAEVNRFHPVRSWLEDLEWDGQARINTWLHVAFGAPLDNYHTVIGAKFLVAAVRRVFQPGCKFDSMLILEGSQGLGKSRACQALFGSSWFADSLAHDLGNKDAAIGLQGKWGIEIAELDSIIRSGTETVKGFLSRQSDWYRPPYGKSFVDRPRQSVFVGTTNQSDYLRDSTGNRRYWPVQCDKAEHAWIAEVRDQLWAEAVKVNTRGEALWLDDDDAKSSARAIQAERMAEDVWAMTITKWLRDEEKFELVISDVLRDALGLAHHQVSRREQMRVATILRAEGWQDHQYRDDKRGKIRAWFKPGVVMPNGKIVPMD